MEAWQRQGRKWAYKGGAVAHCFTLPTPTPMTEYRAEHGGARGPLDQATRHLSKNESLGGVVGS